MTTATKPPAAEALWLDDQVPCEQRYVDYHWPRFAWTLERIRAMGARRVIEVGSHPWVMTSLLVDEPGLEVAATVSAEEVTHWPDDIPVEIRTHRLRTWSGREAQITNYSANIERTLFQIAEQADTVLACEVVEHLIRAPHVMFLNVNRWLPVGGRLLITTPNGLQFSNPLRRRLPMPGYRSNVYERHAYVFALDDLCELLELCGFRIREAFYCDPVPRAGLPRVYGALARAPVGYLREKFSQTICVIAEKSRVVSELPRCPRIYDSRGKWEFVRGTGRAQ